MGDASAGVRKRPRVGDAVSSAAAVAGQDTYKSIADAVEVSGVRKVSIFAVVAEIGAALPSDGTDFYVTLRIADESRKAGISVTFFAKNAALLPRVISNGDVISLQNVVIKEYLDNSFVKFDKRSSFALFKSKVSAGCSPYQTSENYHRREHDKGLLTQMRTWIGSLSDNSLGLKDLELQLRSLKSDDSTFDLVCKVLHVLEDNDKLIFFVWDGTDTPAAKFQTMYDCSSDAEKVVSPKLFEGPALPREVLCKMPCVGTVLKIFSSSDITFKKLGHMKKGIYWARFCNITCKQELGIWKGIFLPSSRVRLLSDEDGSVVDRLTMYNRRNADKLHRRPMQCFRSNVTEVDDKTACYSTLMESLTYSEVTHKVKTLVRVVAAYPCRATDLPYLLTGILLALEDPTARIYAYVHEKELVKFFGGSPIEEVVRKKMNKLLGVPEAQDSEEAAPLTRNPPWIWCCLKSYDKQGNGHWGSQRYQIFGTTIRD